MTNKILKSILAVASCVLVATLTVVMGVLYQYFGDIQQTQLKDDLNLTANATQQLGKKYLEGLDFSSYRLTWVASDGTVLFDSSKDAADMENHADREEIKEALTYGTGSSIRYSQTLTQKNVYEAVLLSDGSVLRISESRATVLVLVVGMLQPIIMIVLAILIVSVLLADKMAKRVVEPLNRLNLDKPLENDVYEELSPLLCRLHAQQHEIKEQMRVVRQKQNEFDQITDNMKEALVLIDVAGRVVSVNPAAKKLFETDITPGEDFFAVDRSQNMQNAIDRARSEGYAAFRMERCGCQYQFDLSSIESDSTVLGIVILAFDITEQVNAERNRREFTANVSHELKTPLQSIIGSAELLENGIVKHDDVPRFISHIRKEAARLLNLIEDIIGLSQLDEGVEMSYEDVSLHAIAEEVYDTISDAASKKSVSVEITGTDGRMRGVRRLLYEIVYNLCDNAVKYNKDNGSVAVNISENEKEVAVSVSDTGIGIASEHQEKVFERFYRVDKSHSKQSGGTGLGLSIVKHAVQCHNGRIDMDSTLGKGTKITVTFNK